jgi:hypothetical protein
MRQVRTKGLFRKGTQYSGHAGRNTVLHITGGCRYHQQQQARGEGGRGSSDQKSVSSVQGARKTVLCDSVVDACCYVAGHT